MVTFLVALFLGLVYAKKITISGILVGGEGPAEPPK